MCTPLKTFAWSQNVCLLLMFDAGCYCRLLLLTSRTSQEQSMIIWSSNIVKLDRQFAWVSKLWTDLWIQQSQRWDNRPMWQPIYCIYMMKCAVLPDWVFSHISLLMFIKNAFFSIRFLLNNFTCDALKVASVSPESWFISTWIKSFSNAMNNTLLFLTVF